MTATQTLTVLAKEDTTNNFNTGGVTGPLGGNTEIFLALGDLFSIAVTGTWSLDGASFIGPEGTTAYGPICNPPGGASGAACGALVGKIGSGNYFLVGTGYSGIAPAAGELFLRNNDNDVLNNLGSLSATITYPDGTSPVPLPASSLLPVSGLVAASLLRSRRKV